MSISVKLDISEQDSGNIYALVVDQVELALLSSIMEIASYNQSKAARLLGISRGTLRTKLSKHFGTKYNTQSSDFSRGE